MPKNSKVCCSQVGTGKNCAKATDAPGGPECKGSQVGLCCDALSHEDNCITVFTYYPEVYPEIHNGSRALPACGDVFADFPSTDTGKFYKLSPFCCDEMNLPAAGCYAVDEPVRVTVSRWIVTLYSTYHHHC